MNKKLYFSSGYPYYPERVILNNVNKWYNRDKLKKPNLILIDGKSSTGKTTLAIHIADQINKKHGLGEVYLNSKDMDNVVQIGTGVDDFISKLEECKRRKLPVIIFDEAGEYNKRGWNSQLNKVVDSIMDTFRAYRIAVIMVLHDFSELPKHVFNTEIIDILIHTKERKKTYGIADFYSHKRLYWVRKFKLDPTNVIPTDAYKKEYKNIRLVFKDLIPERSKELDLISTAHKQTKLSSSEIKLQGLMDVNDIMKKLNRSKIWVRKKISELKLKPKKIFKRSQYFEPEVLSLLELEIKR